MWLVKGKNQLGINRLWPRILFGLAVFGDRGAASTGFFSIEVYIFAIVITFSRERIVTWRWFRWLASRRWRVSWKEYPLDDSGQHWQRIIDIRLYDWTIGFIYPETDPLAVVARMIWFNFGPVWIRWQRWKSEKEIDAIKRRAALIDEQLKVDAFVNEWQQSDSVFCD